MWQYQPTDQLYHHGIKGQKWGVRRFQNLDGTLTPAGRKRYADTIKSATDKAREVGKKATAKVRSVRDKVRDSDVKAKAKKAAVKGAEATAKAMSKIGMAYISDQVFYDGMGTKIAKETIKQTGRAAVTAYTMARGGYDIRWYDN